MARFFFVSDDSSSSESSELNWLDSRVLDDARNFARQGFFLEPVCFFVEVLVHALLLFAEVSALVMPEGLGVSTCVAGGALPSLNTEAGRLAFGDLNSSFGCGAVFPLRSGGVDVSEVDVAARDALAFEMRAAISAGLEVEGELRREIIVGWVAVVVVVIVVR